MEEWREIEGFEGLYQISSFGRVRSLPKLRRGRWGNMVLHKEKFLKPSVNAQGYPRVLLRRHKKSKTFSIHRLIAKAFLPVPAPGQKCVNHKNGIKTDYRIKNLEWCSYSENAYHAFKTGIRKNKKLGIVCLNNGQRFESILDASKKLGVRTGGVSACVAGRYSHTGGLRFALA